MRETLDMVMKSTYVIISDIGHGSGFAIGEEGFILTNYHVVEGVDEIMIPIDGTIQNAEIWAEYPAYDIAVLKVDRSVTPTPISASNGIEPAETLYAIGYANDPTGNPTITQGVFSRTVMKGDVKLIQTDTTINPGSSGGPLMSACGVVGVNTMKLSWDGSSIIEGTGYAISMETVEGIVFEE